MAPRKRGHKRTAIRVKIVESHPLAAERLREILRQSGTAKVFARGRAGTMQGGRSDLPSVVVVDRDTLPGPLDECLQCLRSELPRAKVLVVGRAVPCEDVCQLLFLGVKGFVPYEEVVGRLDAAVRAVSAGRLWAEPEALEEYTERAAKLWEGARHDECKFTPAERRVLGLLQLRLSNKEIAAKMEIGERTVKFHLSNIFRKAGVGDRYSLIDLLKAGRLSGPGDLRPEAKTPAVLSRARPIPSGPGPVLAMKAAGSQ